MLSSLFYSFEIYVQGICVYKSLLCLRLISSITGINSYWKNQGLNAQAMNTATQGNSASTREIVKGNSEPDHLLVLVHGILARYGSVKYD